MVIQEAPRDAFSSGQSSTSLLEVSHTLVPTVLDPTHDEKLNDLSMKLDLLLREQNTTMDPRGFGLGPPVINLNITFPITTKEEFNLFDSSLSDVDYRRCFIKELSKVNGVSGTCDGTKAAYKLCDHIFERSLLNLYSWTGISKSGEKECFTQHANFIEVFCEIIMLADCKYSKANNEKFFKEKVLKYSQSRCKRNKPRE